MIRFRVGDLTSDADFQRIIRFGIVGVGATAIYFLMAISLPGQTWVAISPTLASVLASILSIFASYFGHHKFTFAKTGQHAVFLPRFLLLAGILSAAAALGTYVLTAKLSIGYRLAALIVTVCYPVLSFVLNRLLVFTDAQ